MQTRKFWEKKLAVAEARLKRASGSILVERLHFMPLMVYIRHSKMSDARRAAAVRECRRVNKSQIAEQRALKHLPQRIAYFKSRIAALDLTYWDHLSKD